MVDMIGIVANEVIFEYPSDAAKRWCRDNLVIANPEYAKKARMNLWLGNTPKTLSLYATRGDSLVLPFGALDFIPSDIIDDVVLLNGFESSGEIDYGGNMIPLYDYQKIAVNAVISAGHGILQSPAGSGKTQMGIAVAKKLRKRTLWLTHTHDLLQQSKARAELYMDESLIGTITEGKINIGDGITFATVQTMCKIDLSLYRDYWDVIIVDECQRCSGTPTAMTQFSRVLNSLAARHKIGLSATVHRADGMIKTTYALLGKIVHNVPEEAVGDKIMQVGVFPVGTGVQLSRECLNTDGTLNYTKLITYLCNQTCRTALIASYVSEDSDKSCLILSDRLDHLSQIMATLPPPLQEKAVMISGKMTSKSGKALREKALDDMRTGEKKYLFATYSLAKEGLDIPRLERLFLATPQKDYAVVTQSIGRIARTYEGKADPICYDFIDQMGYTERMFKQRLKHYRKGGCYICE